MTKLNRATLTSVVILYLIAALLSFGYKTIAEADSNVVYVPIDYLTIQQAINHANLGDTIFVYNGTYHEHIVINKSISLIGEDRNNTIIDGGEIGTVISITANNVTVNRFTIQKSSLGLYNSGIFIDHCANNNVSHNKIKDNYHGIYLSSSNDNVISDNDVVSNSYHGIYLDYSTKNVVSNNNASLNDNHGIYLHSSNNNILSNNNASSNTNDGICIYSSDDNIISENDVTLNSFHGLYIHSSSGNIISRNNASSNENDGIYLDDSASNVVSGNEVTFNTIHGFYLHSSNNNIFSSNNISNNDYGIRLHSSSNNNTSYHNNFVKNKNQVWSDSVDIWSHNGEGNCWSDYTGQDLNRDGIGDNPYLIDANNRDNYPLMGRFRIFNVIWKSETHVINVTSNSRISSLRFEAEPKTGDKMVSFSVTGEDGTLGFCRVMIPTELVKYSFFVLVDGEETATTSLKGPLGSSLGAYFTYLHSSHDITVVSSKLLDIYSQLLEKHRTLLLDYDHLNSTYHELLISYGALLGNYSQLLERYTPLNASLQSLLEDYSELETEYASILLEHSQNIGNLVYVFVATTIIFIMTTVYLSTRAHKEVSKAKESQA